MEVPCAPLPRLMDSAGLGAGATFLSLDVEGAEAAVLQTAVGRVSFEYALVEAEGSSPSAVRRVMDMLEQMGLERAAELPALNSLVFRRRARSAEGAAAVKPAEATEATPTTAVRAAAAAAAAVAATAAAAAAAATAAAAAAAATAAAAAAAATAAADATETLRWERRWDPPTGTTSGASSLDSRHIHKHAGNTSPHRSDALALTACVRRHAAPIERMILPALIAAVPPNIAGVFIEVGVHQSPAILPPPPPAQDRTAEVATRGARANSSAYAGVDAAVDAGEERSVQSSSHLDHATVHDVEQLHQRCPYGSACGGSLTTALERCYGWRGVRLRGAAWNESLCAESDVGGSQLRSINWTVLPVRPACRGHTLASLVATHALHRIDFVHMYASGTSYGLERALEPPLEEEPADIPSPKSHHLQPSTASLHQRPRAPVVWPRQPSWPWAGVKAMAVRWQAARAWERCTACRVSLGVRGLLHDRRLLAGKGVRFYVASNLCGARNEGALECFGAPSECGVESERGCAWAENKW